MTGSICLRCFHQDPSNSPGCYAHSLLVYCPKVVTTADVEEGGWIRGFSCLVHLNVGDNTRSPNDPEISLAPFYGLSPTLKSLCVSSIEFPNSQIFGLICSFPLPEDLVFFGRGIEDDNLDVGGPQPVTQDPTSPALTGTLELTQILEMEHTTRRLLGLPNGLHFRNLTLSWPREDHLQWINALVAGCYNTLESLHITCWLRGAVTRLLRRNQRLTFVHRLCGPQFD